MIDTLSVIAADIDGTLCMKGSDIMPLTREALRKLHEQGVLFGTASGRPLDQRTLDKAKQWSLGFELDFAIGMNGGELYDSTTGKYERYYLLQPHTIRRILDVLTPFDHNAIVYRNGYDEIYARRMDDFMRDSIRRNHSHVEIGDAEFLSRFPTGKIEVHIRPAIKKDVLAAVETIAGDDFHSVITFETEDHTTLEFQDPHVNKGVALRKYAEKHAIPLSEVLAFGDMDNDIGLLEAAGYGVCLSNGSEKMKAIADSITEYGVMQDGVGHWLKKYILHEE
ncbi:MAG: HAD family phosphatase [Solobacterium sp.]|nr:HAD family phosphatase [Solobacterium sp.]